MTEEMIRAQYPGISDDLVKQILTLSAGDPSHFAKQYEQGAYLRRMATQGDTKTAAGAIAQTLAGFGAARQDKKYADLVRGYQKATVGAKAGWWNSRYPKPMTMPDPMNPDQSQGVDY